MPYVVFFISLAILTFVGGAILGPIGVGLGAIVAFILALGSGFLWA